MAVLTDGAMQAFGLTLDRFLDHAAKWHPTSGVVTARSGGDFEQIGYAGLRERARSVSAALRGLGVQLGDRVATLAWNSQAHVEAWYGIMGMGAACHTLNPRLHPDQLSQMLASSGARVLIASADLLDLAVEIAGTATLLEHLLVIDGGLPAGKRARIPVQALEPLLVGAGTDVAWGEFDEWLPAGLCFTSGTTGAPKGVTYTHRSNYLHTLRFLQADVGGLTCADSVLVAVPMFHANAWGLPFAVPAVGARLVLPGRATDGQSLARVINSESVTVAVGVPTVWLGLAEHLESVGGAVPSLNRIIVGGAPIPPALMARLESTLGAIVQTSWGMTELSPVGVVASPYEPGRNAAVSGRPALGVDLLLVDDKGEPLAPQRGREGRLRVRGEAVVSRYLGQHTSATDGDGWFDTGDLARIDDRGNVTITGRAKDLIKSGGEWINPAEMETIIGALPQVSIAAVIGRADPKWGERPVLIVEIRRHQSCTDDELLAALRGHVPTWWLPAEIVRVASMPTAATGKIDKRRLRSEYGGSQVVHPDQ